MPWNEADRRKYEVIRARYSSDMSDAEFAIIEALLPPPKRLGRKPTDARVILDALFYMIRGGCPWRLLPKCFPPFTTVQNRFYGGTAGYGKRSSVFWLRGRARPKAARRRRRR